MSGTLPGSPAGQRIAKHSVTIAGHATSVTLEIAFWEELRAIAEARALSVNQLVAEIDAGREGNLSSAIRVHVLDWLRRRAGDGA